LRRFRLEGLKVAKILIPELDEDFSEGVPYPLRITLLKHVEQDPMLIKRCIKTVCGRSEQPYQLEGPQWEANDP
jgi:hypothetical protein